MRQQSFLDDVPDNDTEPDCRGSAPLVKYINGRWCWMVLGTGAAGAPEYRHEPELERILLAALASREQRRAA